MSSGSSKTRDEDWEEYLKTEPSHGLSMKYADGKPMRFRCPYCSQEIRLDPHPGCCGEVHSEPIPPWELDDYDSGGGIHLPPSEKLRFLNLGKKKK